MAEYLGNGIVDVKADVDEALKFFENLGVSESRISKAILTSVGQGGRKVMRQGYRGLLKKRSGKLYKSLSYKVYDKGTQLIFFNYAKSGKKTSKDHRDARYGYMLASGYTIEPKQGHKWLTFMVDNEWRKVKKVTVTPRDYTEGPLEGYFKSNDYDSRVNKALVKQVEKIERKLGVQA